MIRPDEETLKAFVILEGNQAFEKVRKWITQSQIEAAKARSTDAFILFAMISYMDGARQALKDMQEAKSEAAKEL